MNGPGDKYALSSLCTNRQEYERYYATVGTQSAIGEVSPSYLYFCDASARIRDELGTPLIIVAIRNPIEKAYSQYMHLVRDNRETLGFYDALMAERQRAKDGWAVLWRYAESSLYAERIKKYISVFSARCVNIILFEDLLASPEVVMRDLFESLEVDASFQPRTSTIYNRSGKPRLRMLADFLVKPNIVAALAKKCIPEAIRTPIRLALLDMNTGRKEGMDDKSYSYLHDYFYSDIIELEKMLGKKLDWLK